VVRSAVVTAGLLIALLGLIDEFWVAVGIIGLLGVILSICGVGSQILMQTLVDDEVRGRVSSFWGVIAFGGTSLGSLLVGSAAHAWGLQAVVVVAGLACSAAAALTLYHAAEKRRSAS
jgi:predicted MFS family arabinose efflux permease